MNSGMVYGSLRPRTEHLSERCKDGAWAFVAPYLTPDRRGAVAQHPLRKTKTGAVSAPVRVADAKTTAAVR
ncbi:MAG: hypothetical protein QXP27_03940 [Candidatus Methanomethyliaceae archaeon]